MSWLFSSSATPPVTTANANANLNGTEPETPSPWARTTNDDTSPKVPDPAQPGRMVSTKKANQPFLAHKAYRERETAKHDAWVERMKEREKKIARGEKVGPAEKDPTAVEEIGLTGLIKFILYALLFSMLLGKFITNSFLWGYDGKWVRLRTYLPEPDRLFTEEGLSRFDGSNPDLPIFLAIDGDVFDVSSNRRVYGPGGSYHLMSGVDAARSFGTGCFKDHRTHDLRGLTESELRSVNHWREFFRDHKTYHKVGRVIHPPIDPESPIPEHCNPKKEAKRKAKEEERANKASKGHEEL